jgi:hypothetical protein
VESPEAQDAYIYLGFDEVATLLLNGHFILKNEKNKIAVKDEFRIPVKLKQGDNELVMQLEDKRLAWGFYLRIGDENGAPLRGLKYRPE